MMVRRRRLFGGERCLMEGSIDAVATSMQAIASVARMRVRNDTSKRERGSGAAGSRPLQGRKRQNAGRRRSGPIVWHSTWVFKHESMPTCAVARRATSIHTTFVPTDDGVDAGHTTDRKARALCHFRHAGRTLPHPSRCGQVGGLHVALRQRREQLSKRCFGHGASLPATFSAHLTPSRRG